MKSAMKNYIGLTSYLLPLNLYIQFLLISTCLLAVLSYNYRSSNK